jgi:hypothetical protein
VKFDVQLAAYLYENKTLRLEGIGTFLLDSKVSVPHEQEKEIFYPIEGLSFTYNPKATTDEDVIVYLVKKLHKIEPLIRSDIESYLSNIRQFINLGKPYTIEGVGTLSKNNQGSFEFTPGNFLPVKEELNPRRENQEHNYSTRSQSSTGRVLVVILIAVAALAALGGIGWGIYSIVGNRPTTVQNTEQQGYVDTITQRSTDTPTGTAAKGITDRAPAATNPVAPSFAADTTNYKMVFEITSSPVRAYKRTTQLQSYRTNSRYDSIKINNSLFYRLYVPVRIRQRDTTRVKDSLRLFLGSRIRVIKQQ